MASVLITGASTGIGEACALHLDRLGHRVYAGVRRPEDAERLRGEASSRLEPVTLDVCDEGQVAAVAARIDEDLGEAGLSGLVNNAGIAVGGPLEFLPLDEWRRQLEVNVVGQVAVTKAMLPLLRRARGRVVFIGSISGRVVTPLIAPYGASKHAIEAIGASLSEELRPWHMHVAVVEPGAITTAIWGKGRSFADDLERALPPEALELYRSDFDRIRSQLDVQESAGIPPQKVADAVEHALFAPRPKLRYLVGNDARVGALLARLLPDRVRALLLRRIGP